jgi:uncharacterized protein YecE (DUF72 family)
MATEKPQTTHNPLYRLGCPVWNCDAWKGSVYAASAPKDRWLKSYTNVFGTVEGNSTFYGIPRPDTFRRWADQAVDGFKFALKFPRVISHEKELLHAEMETKLFLDCLEILANANRLGTSFLQLGPRFDGQHLGPLQRYLEQLPAEFPFAVEVRHPAWFEAPFENELNQLLEHLEMDRVIFDSRPLYSAPPTDEYEIKSQGRKPKSPIRDFVTGSRPMLRLVGRNDVSLVDPWIEQWIPKVATWINDGLEPYVFLHAPNDAFAPQLAMRFHNALAETLDKLNPFESWPQTTEFQRQLF